MNVNLTTVERVKVLLSGKPDVKTDNPRDNELEAVIATVSGAVERYLHRSARAGTYTEYFDVDAGMTVFRLKAYPVTSFTSANFDPDQDFASTTALSEDDYLDPAFDETGMFRLKFPLRVSYPCPRSLKVVYVGGMAADVDAFVEAYPEISGAVDVQVAHEWQRRGALGVSSMTYPDGTTASMTRDRWIASVAQVLDYYRRLSP